MQIHTIGFTQSSAEHFFTRLADAGVRRVLDIRLSRTSQLAGFAKEQDLPYFLDRLIGASYEHESLLAPSQEIFNAYRKEKGSWEDFEVAFLGLMRERKIEQRLDRASFAAPTALLCSEPTAEHCHRRLIVEYLDGKWGEVEAVHL